MRLWNPFKKKQRQKMDACYELRQQATDNKESTAQRVIEKMQALEGLRRERRFHVLQVEAERRAV